MGAKITKIDTDGVITNPNTLGDLSIDNYIAGGDAGRMYYNDGTDDIAIARKDEIDNIDNTSDADKPVSTAQQAELDLKANAADVVTLAGTQTITGDKTFSGTVEVPTQAADDSSTKVASTAFVQQEITNNIPTGSAPIVSSRFIPTVLSVINTTSFSVTDVVVMYGSFDTTAGFTQTNEILTGTTNITPSNGFGSDGFKYIKSVNGAPSTYVRVDNKPSFGMYTKEFVDDNREVLVDGNWYSTSGGELISNGTFDSNVDGWINGTDCIASFDSGRMKITSLASDASNNGVSTAISTIAGEEYSVTLSYIVGTRGYMRVLVEGATLGNISVTGTYTFNFTASVTGTSSVVFAMATAATTYDYVDNISVYKTQPTLGAALPQQSYLENPDGTLAKFEVVNGDLVAVDKGEIVPSLVLNEVNLNGLSSGTIVLKGLETVDPLIIGTVWNDTGILKISSGV